MQIRYSGTNAAPHVTVRASPSTDQTPTMNTLSIRLRYRPIRVGWCVLKDDIDAFRRALRLSFTLWGGVFNPVIVVNDRELATSLVKLFRVDTLVGVSNDDRVNAFIAEHSHLPWPIDFQGFFGKTIRGDVTSTLVDIRHPISHLYDNYFKNNAAPVSVIELHEWDPADPLADIFLCSYGAYPPKEETGIDYDGLTRSSLFGMPHIIQLNGDIAAPSMEYESIATLCRSNIQRHSAIRNKWDWPGFLVGRADCFDDLVAFWNLRAANVALEFFDERYTERMTRPIQNWANRIRQAPPRPYGPQGLALWHLADHPVDVARSYFGDASLTECKIDTPTWNDLNVRAPEMYFSDASSLASIDNSQQRPSISFSIAQKPFVEDDHSAYQHYVLSIDPGIGLLGNEHATLNLPFLPQLNEFYGREAYGVWNAVRAEPDSTGIVTTVSSDHTWMHALSVQDLAIKIFGQAGIEAMPSKPGLVASTLIRQMGGLDGCRPFKVAGVRTLIEKHRPDQAFNRSTAMQTILGQGSDKPLSEYQELYIAPRTPGTKLTNDALLASLLEKGVFRAGLEFQCPSCRLDFWRSLDDARSRVECDYCGHAFNVSAQLRDKAWAFRRSGLFGQSDHQQGAIPVLLTLQQLMQVQRSTACMFTTAMNLVPKTAAIPACETDFVVMVENRSDQQIEIAIGECKTRQPITSDDVAKLKAVAETFDPDRFSVYIVFAKLTVFSEDEIEAIRSVNESPYLRAIMLTTDELEPYWPYKKLAEATEFDRPVASFADMAVVTARAFLGN